jgi:hypothetical protein
MGLNLFLGRDEQPGRPVSRQNVACEYSLSALPVPAGKRKVDTKRPEG